MSDTISIYFLSLIPGTCWDINDDTSRFTSDDALRRWQPPFGWPHASSSLVEGRGIPKTARDLLYHKTAREWRVHPIMKLETYFYNLENLNHQFSINMQQGRGNLTATQGISFRARAQKTGEARWPRSTGLLIGLTTTPHEPFAKRKDKTKCSSLPAIDKAFILILICRLIFDLICFAFGFVVPNVDLRSHSSSQLRKFPTCQVSVAFWQHCVDPTCMSLVGCRIIPIKPNHYETPCFNVLALNNSENICWFWTFHVHQPADFCNQKIRNVVIMVESECKTASEQHNFWATAKTVKRVLKAHTFGWEMVRKLTTYWYRYGMACLLCTRKASTYLRLLRPWSNDGN